MQANLLPASRQILNVIGVPLENAPVTCFLKKRNIVKPTGSSPLAGRVLCVRGHLIPREDPGGRDDRARA